MNKRAQTGIELSAIVGITSLVLSAILKNGWILLMGTIICLYILGVFNSILSLNIPAYIWIILSIVVIFWIFNMSKGRR